MEPYLLFTQWVFGEAKVEYPVILSTQVGHFLELTKKANTNNNQPAHIHKIDCLASVYAIPFDLILILLLSSAYRHFSYIKRIIFSFYHNIKLKRRLIHPIKSSLRKKFWSYKAIYSFLQCNLMIRILNAKCIVSTADLPWTVLKIEDCVPKSI